MQCPAYSYIIVMSLPNDKAYLLHALPSEPPTYLASIIHIHCNNKAYM